MALFHQIRFFTGIVAAAAGLNAGATEKIEWAQKMEAHNKTTQPFEHQFAPGVRMPEKYRVNFQ